MNNQENEDDSAMLSRGMATSAPLEPEKLRGEHDEYFAQVFPSPPVVCGRQLKPLSLGNYRLMSHFKVAFVAEAERMATPGDLLTGVLICSMEPGEFMAFAAQPDFGRQLQKWGRKMGFFEPRCYAWPWVGKKLRELLEPSFAESDSKYLTEQTELFQQYIAEGSRAPEFWDETPDSKVSAAHWSHSMEVMLRGALHWSKEEVESAPLGKALADYFKHCENLGLVRLMRKEEAAEMARPLSAAEAEEARAAAERTLSFLRGEVPTEPGQKA